MNTGFCATKKTQGKRHLENLVVGGRIILKFILNKAVGVGEK
jgi:hypothetical protein